MMQLDNLLPAPESPPMMTGLLPAPDPPTPTSNSSTGGSPPDDEPVEQEMKWKSSLKNLEYQIELYKKVRAGGGQPSERAAEKVAAAMEHVANSHPDPNVKEHWKDKAKAFRAAGPGDERDGILEEIGKGFLMLLTAPFMLVGAVLQAAGGILNGVGTILKGLGMLSRKLTFTGSSAKKNASGSSSD